MSAALLALAGEVAELARAAGAQAARVKLSRAREVEVEWRDGQHDRLRESTRQGLAIELFVDGRYSANRTSDLRPGVLKRLCREWVAATRLLAPDPARRLPEPATYAGRHAGALELWDDAVRARTPEARLQLAEALEQATRQGPERERLVSVTSWVGDVTGEAVCFNTNGLAVSQQTTTAWQGASAALRDAGERKPSGYAQAVTRFLADLPGAGPLGAEALWRAAAQLGTRQAPTGRYTLVIENRAVPRLFGHLLRALGGDAVQQRRSFLDGRLGQPVGAAALTVRDAPLLPRGLASSVIDGEGMSSRDRAVFASGRLETFFFDTYYAAKHGTAPTTAEPSNLNWGLGTRDAAALVAGLERGILVTDFLGGNSNSTTGDFSLGIKGQLVEQGRPVAPVSEMNMAGNHLTLWQSLVEVGNDPYPFSSLRAPSLCFADVQCSGA